MFSFMLLNVFNNVSLFILVTVSQKFKEYDKINYCYYCKNPQKKIARHLTNIHKNEIWVKQLKAAKEDSGEREKLFIKLRSLGNHCPNNTVLKQGEEEILVVYRPDTHRDPSEYVPCEYCFGWFAGRELWKHYRRCPWNTNANEKTGVSARKRGELHKAVPYMSSLEFREVLHNMQNERIKLFIQGDSSSAFWERG